MRPRTMFYHTRRTRRIQEVGHETLEEWIARLEKGNRERTGPLPAIGHEFTLVDVTGNAAVVRLELHRDGKHTLTDYLSLYRFADGWKIVAKTFHSHAS